jgi:alpha-L-rhamnosidase
LHPRRSQNARLYATALGLFECSVNGQAVSDDVLPGWTDYNSAFSTKVYDVTRLLHEGENAIGTISVMVGL